MPFKLSKPKTNPDGYERATAIEKFVERILVPEKGSVIVPLKNVVFAVIARVIAAPIAKLHRVFAVIARVIVRPLHLPFAVRESVKLEFGLLPGKVSVAVLLSSAALVRMIVHLTVVLLSLGKLMDANVPNAFILNKPAKGGLPRLSDYGRNSRVATRWSVLFGRSFGARSSLIPSFATVCSCLSNVLRGWKLADLLSGF